MYKNKFQFKMVKNLFTSYFLKKKLLYLKMEASIQADRIRCIWYEVKFSKKKKRRNNLA